MSYTLKTILANKSNYGSSRKLSDIKYIVIHYTANDGDSAIGNGNYFKNNVVKASAHYFVDDNTIVQSVMDNYVAWSVGGKKYNDCAKTGGGTLYGKCTNSNSISIELCDTTKDGTYKASNKTIENALDLTKQLMSKYNVPIENVIRHFDVVGKKCPVYWVNNSLWLQEFKNKINGAQPQQTQSQTTEQTSSKLYRVQVGAYSSITNAKNKQKEIQSKGFNCIIKQYNNLYKCQIGAYKNKANAELLLQDLKAKNIDAFITYC